MVFLIVIFLVLNFVALAIGGLFTGKGVPSDWYQQLNKAPWTPPGWVFGAAWTTIMICFAFYMAYVWESSTDYVLLITLYSLQWVLNVVWNPVFFYYHKLALGLLLITALTILVGVIFMLYLPLLAIKAALILPYLIWLLIATSLNAYILIKN